MWHAFFTSLVFCTTVCGRALLPEAVEVLKVLARYDLVLATGHSQPADSLLLISEGRKMGVTRFVVTHAINQGMTIPQYLMAIGQDQESFVAEVREGSTKAVLVDLGLRAVARAEAIEADEAEVEAEVERIVGQVKGSPKKVRRQLEQQGVIDAVRFDIQRGKALQFLVDHATVVDADGNTVDLTIEPPTDDDTPEPTNESPEEEA